MIVPTEERIRQKAQELRGMINAPQIRLAARTFGECNAVVGRIAAQLDDIEARLNDIPPIEVSVLGPSRHGKSTLLNAISGEALLPTSDIKPCTAAIVRLKWAEAWSVTFQFISHESLRVDWQNAVRDAKDFIQRERAGDDVAASVEDQKSFRDGLMRFIELFRIDKNLPHEELVDRVATASIPPEYACYIGQQKTAPQKSLHDLAKVIRHYLSTEDVWWTLVEQCEIAGPFKDWHPSLSVIDLPGTNDTNPHRTAITNRVRDKSQAVAIVTQDSNIGPDIESWLRESSVLSDFIEARDRSRQRMFVVRTQIDSYAPQIEGADSDEDWERLEREAIESYKTRQTATYREMLRDLVLTRLSNARDDASELRRQEILSKADGVEVFFVSALAHESFAGRVTVGPRVKRTFEDRFSGDPEETGIPELRRRLVAIAERYLTDNYYEDLLSTLDREAGLLARYFRKELAILDARLGGAKTSLTPVAKQVRSEVVPWSQRRVNELSNSFRERAVTGNEGINGRLRMVDRLADARLADKLDKWNNLAWSSLRATGRKGGVHTTGRGQHIDITQDICSVLVDDVLLAWTDYRDSVIERGFESLTSDYANQLLEKLAEAARLVEDADSATAVRRIMDHLADLTEAQRRDTLGRLERVIRGHASIRRPAYDYIQQRLNETFVAIGEEHGPGCAARMRDRLTAGYKSAIGQIRAHVRSQIDAQVADLLKACDRSFREYGAGSCDAIASSIKHAESEELVRERARIEQKRDVAVDAIRLLPAS